MIASEIRKLPCFLNGGPRLSDSRDYFDIFDPSTGQVIAQAPDCTEAEVNAAVESAREAFPAWAEMPAMKRVQILFRFRDMIEANLPDLTRMVATEHGKVWDEAQGDVLKAKEVVEVACGIPSLMQGKSMMNASAGYDYDAVSRAAGRLRRYFAIQLPGDDPDGLDDATLHRDRQHAGVASIARYSDDLHANGRDVV